MMGWPKADQKIVVRSRVLYNNYLEGLFHTVPSSFSSIVWNWFRVIKWNFCYLSLQRDGKTFALELSNCSSFLVKWFLRAVVCKYQEFGARSKNSIFFLFYPKNPFGKLFLKTIFKSSSETPFLRKIGKLKIGLNLVKCPTEIMQLGAYSKCAYEKTKANL